MKIAAEKHRQLCELLAHMEKVRSPWWNNWRDISDYFLPRRYPWLLTDKEVKSASVRNQKLLDSTSTIALRTLATGMMNGITSPARPWFRLRLAGFDPEAEPREHRLWLDVAAERMLLLMSESNFYNALGILYLEWAAFGTAAMAIHEDEETVFRAYNFAVGEFFINVDYTGRVNAFARKFTRTVEQVVKEFGLENVPEETKTDYEAGGVRRQKTIILYHLIQENEDDGLVRKSAAFREYYWVASKTQGELLRLSPLDEFPCIAPRWDVYGPDVYGSSPCMDALPDVKQLQQMVKRRAQGLDKLVSPPMLINQRLANSPKSLAANGYTYVPGSDLNEGARPVYQINMPFAELNGDILDIRQRIQQVLFNDLFRMISQLETVRSATEIDARREEKLVLLGPVLERFQSEGLGPCIDRVFQICLRTGVFPPLPEGLEEADLQVEYTGVLSDAQRAVGTVPIERWLQLVGNVAPLFPEALEVPDAEEMLREYAENIGLKTRLLRGREEVAVRREQRQASESALEAAQAGQALVGGAQQLSQTDLGGGQNALQALLGGQA